MQRLIFGKPLMETPPDWQTKNFIKVEAKTPLKKQKRIRGIRPVFAVIKTTGETCEMSDELISIHKLERSAKRRVKQLEEADTSICSVEFSIQSIQLED